MKTLAFAIALATVGASFGQAVRAPRHADGPGVDQEYDQYYSPAHEVTISGIVTGKVKGTPTDGKAESMSILVRTSRGHIYSVDLGPSWYVREQDTKINMGDRVKVVGSPIRFSSGENVILAKQVVDRHNVLAIRDEAGTPYWMAFLPGVDHSISGTIVGMQPVTIRNQQEAGLQLQTDQGMVDVALAPEWYMEQQGIGFHVGENATVYYGSGPARFNNVIIANGMYLPGYTKPLVLPPQPRG